MSIEMKKEDLRIYARLDIISQLTLVKEHCSILEEKYHLSFEDFEKKMAEQEIFEEWDDYIEWKAYQQKKRDLEMKLAEIDRADSFRIT